MNVITLPPPLRPYPGLAGRLAFDPLAPLLAVLPLIAVIGTSLSWHPGALVLLGTLPLLVAAQPRRGGTAAAAILVFSSLMTLGFASSDTHRAPVEGALALTLPLFPADQWNGALDLSARFGSIIALLVLSGLLTRPEDTVLALVLHMRMPSRLGEAGRAALTFFPSFRREHRAIREAHLLRGSRLNLPVVNAPMRWVRSLPALVAAAIRRAERVSMSMDARAFGAYPQRTERTSVVWRLRDWFLLFLAAAVTALLVYIYWDFGFSLSPEHS